MNFYELEAFVILADTLHFGKAASKLNMSPSALSRIISRIEDEMETTLIDRSNRQVAITEKGNLFYKYAKDTLEKRSEIKEAISGNDEKVSGILKLYASVTACYTILPDFIKRLNKKYPDIQLSVETGDPAGAIAAVKEGRALLAVAAIPESGVASMDTVSVQKTPLVYAAAKNGPFVNIEGSPQDIVSSVPLILPKTGLARTRFDKWVKSRNVKPIIAAETEGNEAILAIAQLGLGIGLVPQIVLENGPYKGEFISHTAGNALGYYDVGFIRKAEISGTPLNRKMQEAVEQILRIYY
ncbi:MAG: HTH-type transcriptional activator IlvY [Treponema sp.]|nr:HTH-type transcriptional activator IlvY [Treponema sp.]